MDPSHQKPAAPSRVGLAIFAVLLLVDLGAVVTLALLVVDDLRYGGDAGPILVALLLAVVGCTAGAVAGWRRRRGLAYALAGVPAALTVLAAAAITYFFMTFASQPHH